MHLHSRIDVTFKKGEEKKSKCIFLAETDDVFKFFQFISGNDAEILSVDK